MKRAVFPLLLAVAAGCSGAADVPERSAEEQLQIADSRLVVDVKDRLLDDHVAGNHRMRVECSGAIVTLEGEAPSKEAARAAEASARRVPGVRGVLNRLRVTP